MEDKDKRRGWLRELKAGDKVFISSRYRSAIKTIDKITLTGRIAIGNTKYDSTGYEIGGDTWSRESLSEWNQEEEDDLLQKIKFEKMCNKLSDVKWHECDYNLVEKAYALLDKE